jgi:hypothetical protein
MKKSWLQALIDFFTKKNPRLPMASGDFLRD